VGFLDGGAAALFAELFTPLYLPATVYAVTTTHNERGDPRRALGERPCLAQVDGATHTMRGLADFTTTDRAVYVLANTLEGVMAEGHEIVVHKGPYAGTRWKIADPIDRDPGAAYWLCRAVLGKAA
jgi:hypothetical protein